MKINYFAREVLSRAPLAAMDGHLDCLKYAHENGCPWDENTARYAALGGNLDCLKYVYENGCPWDVNTTACAASDG